LNHDRRAMLRLLATLPVVLALPHATRALPAPGRKRQRLIVDNDFAGDPDGLVQMAHHLRSPSVDIRLIIGSHLHADEAWVKTDRQATASAATARELLSVMGLAGTVPVIAGAERAMPTADVPPEPTAAAKAIIAEAMRDDPLPLFYCAGAGLTDLAMALRIEPRIAGRLTLVWIGGPEYPGLGLPVPGGPPGEYNMTIDVPAVQAVFNRSAIPVWQVPRNTYRRMLFSMAEVAQMKRAGVVAAWLARKIEAVAIEAARFGVNTGETYVLGDSPLVTLTALQSAFEADPASSDYTMVPAPAVQADGTCQPDPNGRPIRVYTTIDTRLTFGDMLAKLR
jgi:purine nucleosidase